MPCKEFCFKAHIIFLSSFVLYYVIIINIVMVITGLWTVKFAHKRTGIELNCYWSIHYFGLRKKGTDLLLQLVSLLLLSLYFSEVFVFVINGHNSRYFKFELSFFQHSFIDIKLTILNMITFLDIIIIIIILFFMRNWFHRVWSQ
jgi:hypothetical protein